MKPPYCCLCHRPLDLDEKDGLVEFAKTDKDREWDRRVFEEGLVGHPPYADWFCQEHYARALRLQHLTFEEALISLRSRP